MTKEEAALGNLESEPPEEGVSESVEALECLLEKADEMVESSRASIDRKGMPRSLKTGR